MGSIGGEDGRPLLWHVLTTMLRRLNLARYGALASCCHNRESPSGRVSRAQCVGHSILKSFGLSLQSVLLSLLPVRARADVNCGLSPIRYASGCEQLFYQCPIRWLLVSILSFVLS